MGKHLITTHLEIWDTKYKLISIDTSDVINTISRSHSKYEHLCGINVCSTFYTYLTAQSYNPTIFRATRFIFIACLIMTIFVSVTSVSMSTFMDYEQMTLFNHHLNFSNAEDPYVADGKFSNEDFFDPKISSRLNDEEVETIRSSIVEGLGLKKIPDPSKANVSQSEYERAHKKYFSRLYSQGKERKRFFTIYATEQHKNITCEFVPHNDTDSSYNQLLFFRIQTHEKNSVVEHANLRLLLGNNDFNGNLSIRIYRHRTNFISQHLLSITEYAFNLGEPKTLQWIELDFTQDVAESLESATQDICLKLKFMQNGVPVHRSFFSPAINVFTVTKAANRIRKRAAAASRSDKLISLHKGRRTECRGDNKKCCRHQMTVIFKDLKGFEFIIQPKTFDAGYCKGRCPPRYNPAHHHALLQSLIWKEDRQKVPRPCCAPSKLAELEILYFDENDSTKLKVSNWKNMKVLECACS